MGIVEKLFTFITKQVETVIEFLENPNIGVYEFRDKLTRNFRVFIYELLTKSEGGVSTKNILRE